MLSACQTAGLGSTAQKGANFLKRGRLGVRRTILLLAATALALTLAGGVALAQQQYGDQQGGQGVTKTCPTACQGTSYPDTLKGTSASNHIKGLGGNEGLRTGDLIQGFANHDLLYGNPGGDRIEGGNGNDAIFGGLGQDLLIGGTGNDHLDGGSGGDTIMVKDGYVDHVNCEGGNDDVSNRDSFDVLRNC
jgi:Ca2+-binding RTX toxin-like protein